MTLRQGKGVSLPIQNIKRNNRNPERIKKEAWHMSKIDFKKEWKHLYHPSSKKVNLVDVPAMQFVAIDGVGDPNNSQSFRQATEALYGMAFTIKFSAKEEGQDFTVMPLEALWWMKNGTTLDIQRKSEWLWTVMIMLPDFVTPDIFDQAKEKLKNKKNPAALSLLRLDKPEEKKAITIMHIGPYNAEGPTLAKMYAFARENDLTLAGKHHEIYLSDPRRTAPEKLKTVLRHPVKPIKG